jgi:hypothetical protein
MFSEEERFRPGPRSYTDRRVDGRRNPGPGQYSHQSSVREVLEKRRDRQVTALAKVARSGGSGLQRATKLPDEAQQDAFHMRLPGRERAAEAKDERLRVRTQQALLKSLYSSERTVALLQKIPNMRPFLKETFGSEADELRLVRDLEYELSEKTPNVRGKSAKALTHDRSACLDIIHKGVDGKSPTLMAVGKHKFNWELELDAGRGPGTYNYEHAKGGPIKESHNWKWKRLEAFKEESDSELEVDAKENIDNTGKDSDEEEKPRERKKSIEYA